MGKLSLRTMRVAFPLLLALFATQVSAISLYYDFEGDSGDLATDKLPADGAQDGNLLGNVSFQTSPPGIVPYGTQSALFDPPFPVTGPPPYSTIEIPGSTLGADFTLSMAMHANSLESDFTRLFSSFGGTGPVGTDRLVMDVDQSASVTPGVRAIVNNMVIQNTAPIPNLANPGYHHYAMTVNSGTVKIYVDGAEVASGNVGSGYSNSVNIHIGEDPHDVGGTADEQLIGNLDDVLVTDQLLTPAQIASLAGGATVLDVIGLPSGSLAVNYSFEGDTGTSITDKLTGDGAQDGIVHQNVVVDNNPAQARLGNSSAKLGMPIPGDPFSQIATNVTGLDLGSEFTMSAVINVPQAGFSSGGLTRLFSTFDGSGPIENGHFIFDFDPDASLENIGIRVVLPDGTQIRANVTFSKNESHTLTAVYDNGDVRLYLDGVEVQSGSSLSGPGPIDLAAFLLHIGEDLAGPVNENFIGTLDDVLILDSALSSGQVAQLHAVGAAVFLADPSVGVSEPACIALIGLGLVGISARRRRARKA